MWPWHVPDLLMFWRGALAALQERWGGRQCVHTALLTCPLVGRMQGGGRAEGGLDPAPQVGEEVSLTRQSCQDVDLGRRHQSWAVLKATAMGGVSRKQTRGLGERSPLHPGPLLPGWRSSCPPGRGSGPTALDPPVSLRKTGRAKQVSLALSIHTDQWPEDVRLPA